MVTVVEGYRSGNTTFNQNQKIVDMKDTILELKPSMYPLTAIIGRIRKVQATQAKFEWLEDERMPHWDAATIAHSAVATDIYVDNAEFFESGMTIVFPRTGEVARCTGTTVTSDYITVVRGTGAATINAAEPIMIIADSNEEGATSKDGKQTVLTNAYNYTQIFRTPVSITRTESKANLIGGNELDRQRAKRGQEHQEKIERALWFGKRAIVTSGTHPRRFTGGIFEWITTNITDFGGMMTEFDCDQFLETASYYGSENKLAFMAARPISVVNGFAKDRLYVVDQAKKEFGLDIVKYVSPQGTLNMVKHPMFEGAVYGYYMCVLDLSDDCIEYKFIDDTQLHQNIQANDLDGQKDEYLTEAGLLFANEKRHSLGKNIKS